MSSSYQRPLAYVIRRPASWASRAISGPAVPATCLSSDGNRAGLAHMGTAQNMAADAWSASATGACATVCAALRLSPAVGTADVAALESCQMHGLAALRSVCHLCVSQKTKLSTTSELAVC
jgi:hypothetical protein